MHPDLENLHYLSATEAIESFRTGDLSPVDLLNAVVERANQIDDTVNPFADKYFDEALARAESAEAR